MNSRKITSAKLWLGLSVIELRKTFEHTQLRIWHQSKCRFKVQPESGGQSELNWRHVKAVEQGAWAIALAAKFISITRIASHSVALTTVYKDNHTGKYTTVNRSLLWMKRVGKNSISANLKRLGNLSSSFKVLPTLNWDTLVPPKKCLVS